jgi:hypothetical protein
MIINDRHIVISAAGSRKATFWPAQKLYWSELLEKLKVPARGAENFTEYLSYPKSKQDEFKDVGGFVAGRVLQEVLPFCPAGYKCDIEKSMELEN